MYHRPPVTSGHLTLTESPWHSSAHLTHEKTEYTEYCPQFAAAYCLKTPVPKVSVILLPSGQSKSFPQQLPEGVNPSQCMEESPYGMMSAERIYLSPIQILTPASAEYSSVLIVHSHKSCFIWYILEKIYLYSFNGDYPNCN